MDASSIFTIVIMVLAGLLFVGIGISNIKSKEPVGFYSGVKPPKAEELSDVVAWNCKHGLLWISYGIGLMICWFGFLIGEILGFCTVIGICIGGVLWLMIGHHKLEKKYRK